MKAMRAMYLCADACGIVGVGRLSSPAKLLVPDELCGLCLMVWVWVQELLEVHPE